MNAENSNNEGKEADSMSRRGGRRGGGGNFVSKIFALFLLLIFAYVFIFSLAPTLSFPYNILFDILLIFVFTGMAITIMIRG